MEEMKMNRVLTMIFLIACMACLLISAPCVAGDLVASWDISIADGVKTYAYTFTGLPMANAVVDDIMVGMPEDSARTVFTATCSDPDWYIYSGLVGYGEFEWGMIGGELAEGESITMWLKTSADVPTLYEMPNSNTANWGYHAGHSLLPGNSVLPYPSSVPEPSSILGLTAGLLPMGMMLRRRRK